MMSVWFSCVSGGMYRFRMSNSSSMSLMVTQCASMLSFLGCVSFFSMNFKWFFRRRRLPPLLYGLSLRKAVYDWYLVEYFGSNHVSCKATISGLYLFRSSLNSRFFFLRLLQFQCTRWRSGLLPGCCDMSRGVDEVGGAGLVGVGVWGSQF